MILILIIFIYLILYFLFFRKLNLVNISLKNPLITIFIFSCIFFIVSYLIGQLNNTYGNYDDITNYINWMQNLKYRPSDYEKAISWASLLNFFNFIGFGYEFSFKVLIPILTIFISLLSLFFILPQSSMALINSYFLLLPCELIQESFFSTMRHGLAIALSFLSISLIFKFNNNKSNGIFLFEKLNIIKIIIIIFCLFLSSTTHISSIILFSLLLSSIFLDFILNLIIQKIKFIPFYLKYFFIHISILIGLISANNINNVDFSLLSFFPPLYEAILNHLIQIPINEISKYLDTPPIHRPIIYSLIFIYFYIVNSILRFKYPTNLNKFNYILSIFSLISLSLVFSPISLVYPVMERFTLYAFIALAINSGTLFYRINNLNLNILLGFNQRIIKKTTLILMHGFSLYLFISFIK